MNQTPLFVDDVYIALSDVVRALGGFKAVGVTLKPDRPADEAGRWLADCLNKERRYNLELEQILWLLKEGRRVGCHTAMHFMNQQAGYAAQTPVEPDDEAAELQRQFMAAVQAQAKIVERLERLQPSLKRAA